MKNKLVNYMKYIVENYPNGCASSNWKQSYYNDILEGKILPEEYEIETIVEECLKEFHYEDLGLCGCGCPEETYKVLREILNIKSSDIGYEERQKQYSDICSASMENENYSGLIQFVLYILDNKEFLEHGSSIGGAWLTEKGKIYLDLLNIWYKLNF